MRALLFTLVLALVNFSALCQINISTNLRSNYDWNATTEKWDWVSDDPDEKTFMEINKDMTILKHTTPTIYSTYIIKSYEKDVANDQWKLEVKSDVGNSYTMYIDVKNNNVRFVGKRDGEYFLVRHTIKRIWSDE